MDIRLSRLIRWLEREELHKTMPLCFRLHYDLRVTSIIDCFEVFIEKPTFLMARSAIWPTYKHHNTVKYVFNITPKEQLVFYRWDMEVEYQISTSQRIVDICINSSKEMLY